jgi:hypothetical protein
VLLAESVEASSKCNYLSLCIARWFTRITLRLNLMPVDLSFQPSLTFLVLPIMRLLSVRNLLGVLSLSLLLGFVAAQSSSSSQSGSTSASSTTNSASNSTSSPSVTFSLTTATTTETTAISTNNKVSSFTTVVTTTFNASITVSPTSSTASSATVSPSQTADPRVLQTKLDPAFGVLGAILILTGLPSAFWGHKNRWTSFFLIGFYTISLVCFVLILKFGILPAVNPPSKTLRGMFVLACAVAGIAGGGFAIFFWKAARYGIGAWGGFALALWIQCFRDGGVIRSEGLRWIMYIGARILIATKNAPDPVS